MRKMKYAVLAMLMLLSVACASSTPQDNIRKAVIGIHDGIYVPVSTKLAIRLNRGDVWVMTNQAKIQAASEEYVKVKDDVDAIVSAWDDLTSPSAASDKIQRLMKLLADLQRINEVKK